MQKPLAISSCCSGLDGCVDSFRDIFEACMQEFDYVGRVNHEKLFTHEFACDNDGDIQKFLLSNRHMCHLFSDITELQNTFAYDVQSGEKKMVPWVAFNVTGWSCVDHSVLNPNDGAQEDEDGESMITFNGFTKCYPKLKFHLSVLHLSV